MRKLWRNKPLLIAAVAIVLCLCLAAFTAGERTVQYTDGLFRTASVSVRGWIHGVQAEVGDFFVRVFRPSAVQEENDRLKEQLLEAERRLSMQEELAQENARLTELLNFVSANENIDYLTASVIGRDTNPYVETLTLNVGSRHGVKQKMAVLTADGIVGRVSEVGPTWCRVKTMCNEDLRISVMVERTRDEGMVGGLHYVDGTLLGVELYYLASEAEVKEGDRIITSGLGGIFPKGLYVGEVLLVNEDGSGTYDAVVELAVDFAHVENVLVLTGFEGMGE